MTYEELHRLLEERRSVRYYADTPVGKEDLQKILASATLAPSVENMQPWRLHVINNADLKAKLMEHSCYGNFVAGAATFILVACDRSAQSNVKNTIWNPREMEYSCIAAMQNIMLAATSMQIGSCWVSLHHGPVHNILKLPDYHVVVGGIMLGHLKKGEEESSDNHVRRPVDDCVVYHD